MTTFAVKVIGASWEPAIVAQLISNYLSQLGCAVNVGEFDPRVEPDKLEQAANRLKGCDVYISTGFKF